MRFLTEPVAGLLMIPLMPFIAVGYVLFYLFAALCQLGNYGLSAVGLTERRRYFDYY